MATEAEHSSEYIYRGKVVTLRIDTVRTSDGREIKREVVEHHGAVAIVPLLNSETVLLIRQFRQAVGETLLEIPAGTLETGEEPDVCAARELEEEIGYRPGKLRRMFSQYLAPGYSSEVLHAYLGEDLIETAAHPDEDEQIEVVPVEVRRIEAMILNGDIRDSKSIAALLVALRLMEK
jgi:nudix-type nucleoside diphosphatase (YffH/AdpP family)